MRGRRNSVALRQGMSGSGCFGTFLHEARYYNLLSHSPQSQILIFQRCLPLINHTNQTPLTIPETTGHSGVVGNRLSSRPSTRRSLSPAGTVLPQPTFLFESMANLFLFFFFSFFFPFYSFIICLIFLRLALSNNMSISPYDNRSLRPFPFHISKRGPTDMKNRIENGDCLKSFDRGR